MDGATEDKTFAAAYGEFFTSDGVDTEALAMAVPTDAASEPVPESLVTITDRAATVFAAADASSWDGATAAMEDMNAAWADHAAGDVPRLVEPLIGEALDALNQAIGAQDAEAARQATINVARLSLDLQLRYRPVTEVDLGRFDLWLAQLQLDAAAEDAGGVNGDLLTLDYVRDRIVQALDASTAAELNLALEELQTAVTDGDFTAASEIAHRLRGLVSGL
jgi:hypothetical protein